MNTRTIEMHKEVSLLYNYVEKNYPEVNGLSDKNDCCSENYNRIVLKQGCLIASFKNYNRIDTCDLTKLDITISDAMFESSDDRFTEGEELACRRVLDEAEINDLIKCAASLNKLRNFYGIYRMRFNNSKYNGIFLYGRYFLDYFGSENYSVYMDGYYYEFEGITYRYNPYREPVNEIRKNWKEKVDKLLLNK